MVSWYYITNIIIITLLCIQQQGIDFINNVMSRIKTSTDTKSSITDTDLVIEAIVENLEIKRSLFADMDSAAPQLVYIWII